MYPDTQLRLHANARVLPFHLRFDASSDLNQSAPYFEALADRSRRLGAAAMSIHAGERVNTDDTGLYDNLSRIQDIFGDIRVAVEGMYPSTRTPYLMDTREAYEDVLRRGVPFALDLSHLQIVAHQQQTDCTDLARDMVASPQCLEVHLSDNDSVSDRHNLLCEVPWWWEVLEHTHENALLFTEGNQIRHQRSIAA